MEETNYTSIGLFIDGGYYAKINEGLAKANENIINVKGLFEFIKKQVSSISHTDKKYCQITESHFYRGRYRVSDAQDKDLLYNERLFEDSLIENDVVFHYKHLRKFENNGRVSVVEKGVDVWFALEAYEMALFRELDYVVLITGDADHEMLIKKLKAIKTKVILLTWDTSRYSATSVKLSEEACEHWEISEMVKIDDAILDSLTRL